MKITITRADNGAIVDYDYEDKDQPALKHVYNYEEGNIRNLVYMFWDICDAIQPPTGKYQKERISIDVIHGRGYECKDKKCEICNR